MHTLMGRPLENYLNLIFATVYRFCYQIFNTANHVICNECHEYSILRLTITNNNK